LALSLPQAPLVGVFGVQDACATLGRAALACCVRQPDKQAFYHAYPVA
jgi:hypothetical protein